MCVKFDTVFDNCSFIQKDHTTGSLRVLHSTFYPPIPAIVFAFSSLHHARPVAHVGLIFYCLVPMAWAAQPGQVGQEKEASVWVQAEAPGLYALPYGFLCRDHVVSYDGQGLEASCTDRVTP